MIAELLALSFGSWLQLAFKVVTAFAVVSLGYVIVIAVIAIIVAVILEVLN